MSAVESVVVVVCVVSLASLGLQILGLLRRPHAELGDLQGVPAAVQALSANHERLERALREEVAKSREEALVTARGTREELAGALGTAAAAQQHLVAGAAQASEAKQEKLREVVERHLVQIAQDNASKLDQVRLQALHTAQSLQEETGKRLDKMRQESAEGVARVRDEVTTALKAFDASVIGRIVELSAVQKDQLEQVTRGVVALAESNEKRFEALRANVDERLKAIQEESSTQLGGLRTEAGASSKQTREEVTAALKAFNDSVVKQMVDFADKLDRLTTSNQLKLDELKGVVDLRLKGMQEDNAKQLEQMRVTVDEKLQGTLEKRLGDSFKQVSERLEQVYKGLGEMQVLATGVGDLKKVLSNVKTRGTWGEVQLGALLEQVLSPAQYAANVSPKNNGERVEFAVKMPARGGELDAVVWLPIDAKFPLEDYQRLVDAQEAADTAGIEAASGLLDIRIRQCAKDIADKYVSPPQTTDFGILFLPTEGLFAEVVRRPGLCESIQQKSRVVIAGPTTLWSILTSLQMGFRTLAIQKRSSEVWNLLAAVKAEWTKYGEILDKVNKKLQEATNTMDAAAVRTRAIGRKLRAVEELPPADAELVLGLEAGGVAESSEESV